MIFSKSQVLALLRASPFAKLVPSDSEQQLISKINKECPAALEKLMDLYEDSLAKLKSYDFAAPETLIVPIADKEVIEEFFKKNLALVNVPNIKVSNFVSPGKIYLIDEKQFEPELNADWSESIPFEVGKGFKSTLPVTQEMIDDDTYNTHKATYPTLKPFQGKSYTTVAFDDIPTESRRYITFKSCGWRYLWKYVESRAFSESLRVLDGTRYSRGFLHCFSYYDYDMDCRVFYPFGINYIVAWWRKIQRETMWGVLNLDKRAEGCYLKGYYDAMERVGKMHTDGYNMGYKFGLTKGREEAIDEILISYAHDVVREQRKESREKDEALNQGFAKLEDLLSSEGI